MQSTYEDMAVPTVRDISFDFLYDSEPKMSEARTTIVGEFGER